MQHNILNIIRNDFTMIRVAFSDSDKNNGKTYTYKALLADEVIAGDTVVVNSPSSGLVCVKVTEVHDFANIDPDAHFPQYKWIVQKVCTAQYDDNAAAEAETLQGLAKLLHNSKRVQEVDSFREQLTKGADRKAFDKLVAPWVKDNE